MKIPPKDINKAAQGYWDIPAKTSMQVQNLDQSEASAYLDQ